MENPTDQISETAEIKTDSPENPASSNGSANDSKSQASRIHDAASRAAKSKKEKRGRKKGGKNRPQNLGEDPGEDPGDDLPPMPDPVADARRAAIKSKLCELAYRLQNRVSESLEKRLLKFESQEVAKELSMAVVFDNVEKEIFEDLVTTALESLPVLEKIAMPAVYAGSMGLYFVRAGSAMKCASDLEKAEANKPNTEPEKPNVVSINPVAATGTS